MSKEEKNTYTIKTDENLGEVKIADEVVAIIAGLAAMEVEGVASMANSYRGEALRASQAFGVDAAGRDGQQAI